MLKLAHQYAILILKTTSDQPAVGDAESRDERSRQKLSLLGRQSGQQEFLLRFHQEHV